VLRQVAQGELQATHWYPPGVAAVLARVVYPEAQVRQPFPVRQVAQFEGHAVHCEVDGLR